MLNRRPSDKAVFLSNRAVRSGQFRKSLWRAPVVALTAMLILTACGEPTTSQEARDRARELESSLANPEGPAAEHLAVLFGDDGAHLCAAADSIDHLSQVAFIPHGFALRKLTVDPTDVEFARIVIDVYCPENRQTFDDYVGGLEIGESDG